MMKGIVLAGGGGNGLYLITKGVSKQLLPMYDKPMVYYPISARAAEFVDHGNCLGINEKPVNPQSNSAIVGLYSYPNMVVDVAKHTKPSTRGELEITTVNQEFLKGGELKVRVFCRGFARLDSGTHNNLS